jgi:Fic family protein
MVHMKREYETTHPWITFSVRELQKHDPVLWAMLGECQSKCGHIAGVPLSPDIADRFHRLYLAKGAHATTAIEGNTLSEEEVLAAIDGKLKLPPSREYLEQEVQNVIRAFESIFDAVGKGPAEKLGAKTFKGLNKAVLKGLAGDDHVVPGEIRNYSVGVARYRGAPAEDCEFLLDRLGEWLDGPEFRYPEPGIRVALGILKAILAHLYLAWIHPFGDGNGRTARLVEFQILVSYGIATPAVHLLSNHYNMTRAEYYRQLDRASRSGGEVMPFIRYAVQGFLDGLREQIAQIRNYQLDIMWSNYVHERFGSTLNVSDLRRRNLVLDLSKQQTATRPAQIPFITRRTAEAYHGKSEMTLKRDIRFLQRANLIVKSKAGILPNKALIEAFLPNRVDLEKIKAIG